jgi:hypothetical protein
MNLDSLIPIMLTIMGALLAGSATFLFRGGTTPPPTPDQPRRTISASHLVLTIFAVIVVLFGGVTLVRYFPIIKQNPGLVLGSLAHRYHMPFLLFREMPGLALTTC